MPFWNWTPHNFSENLQCVGLCSQVFAQLMGRKSWKTSRKESNLFLVQGELKAHEELWMLTWQAITLTPLICLESWKGQW